MGKHDKLQLTGVSEVNPPLGKGAHTPWRKSLTADRGESKARIHHFAEMLLNLQCVAGFDDRIRQIRSLTSDQQLEGAYAELEGASILYMYSLDFKFVEKVKNPKLGSDYDFEVFKNGKTIAVDATCKLASTEIDQSSLMDSLQAKRRRLPENEASSIILKIPSHWFVDPQTRALDPKLRALCSSFFWNTGRVMSIVFYTPFRKLVGTTVNRSSLIREVPNPHCRHTQYVPKHLLREASEATTLKIQWVILSEILDALRIGNDGNQGDPN